MTTKEPTLRERMTLRNTHQVCRHPDPDARPGDVAIESFRRSLSKADALGLVVHLMEKAGLTIEDVRDGIAELASVRETVQRIMRIPSGAWKPAEKEIVERLGLHNETP